MSIRLSIPTDYLIVRDLNDYHTIDLHHEYEHMYVLVFIGDYHIKDSDTVINVENLLLERFGSKLKNNTTRIRLPNKFKPQSVNLLVLGYDPVLPLELDIDKDLLYPARVVNRGNASINLPLEYYNKKVQVLFYKNDSTFIEEIHSVLVDEKDDKHAFIRFPTRYLGKKCYILDKTLD